MEKHTFQSLLGGIYIEASPQGLRSLRFVPEENVSQSTNSGFLQECEKQIKAYLKGDLKTFDLDLDLNGSPFQQSVWAKLREIPYGKTWTYQALSRALGNEKAIRAVGSANGANPVLIIVPCHRVIAKDGQLRGYAGELWRKQKLLELEGAASQLTLF